MRTSRTQHGFVLIAVMLLTFFVITAATVTAQLASSNLRAANIETHRVNAQFAADAGADYSMFAINDGLINATEWFGTGGAEITVADQTSYRTTFKSEVTNETINGLNRKLLKVTGKTYSPKTSTSPISSRTYKIIARPIEAGNFAVVTGVGGLIMENSSKIIGGSVFVNGKITMSGSSQIGLSTAPVDVFAAHQNCPLDGSGSYPQQCSSGNGEPISISNPAWIYGEVRAQNQTTGDRMSTSGLTTGATVTPLPLPTHDRDAQKTAVVGSPDHNLTGSDASCTTNNGTKTWKANSKITGDVTINKSCTVTVEGDIWITGSIELSQSGTLKVAMGVASSPVIMVDDTVTARNSAKFASNTNSTPVGFRIITYKSAASCSPDCANVSGIELFNSQDIETITLVQSTTGPNTEFYAKWSQISVGNSGGIGAVTGQTIKLHNSAAITFGAKVSGVPTIFGWVVESYRRDFTPL